LISLAGVPPLLGFIGKFLLFIFLIKSSNWLIIIFFSLINFFVIYFYIQNLRFLVTKTLFFFFNFQNYYVFFNFNLILLLVLLNTLNFFGILFIDDFILLFSYASSFLFFN
jgi:NADH:ubiquinone oxidoreductase subunit 2 (subunit N)